MKSNVINCINDLHEWCKSRKSFRFTGEYNIFVNKNKLKERNNIGEIHCYIGNIFDGIKSNFSTIQMIDFLLEHITQILIKHKIESISFGFKNFYVLEEGRRKYKKIKL